MAKSLSGKLDINEMTAQAANSQRAPEQPTPQAPAQKEYIALIGHGAFADKTALIPIRLHNTDLSGARFEALIKAARLRFDKYTLVLMDSIENHLIGSGGRAKAQDWIRTNKDVLTPKDIDSIITWANIRDMAGFARKHSMLELLYQTNDDARYYVNWACAQRMQAIKAQCIRNGVTFDEKKMMKNVLNYRLEELAGLSMLRDKADMPEICSEDFVNDDLLYDRLSSEKLAMPRVLPVTFQLIDELPPLSLED